MSSIREVEHLQIPLPLILSATNNFDEKKLIGKGGFGKVYQGQSEQYGTIAVKRLDRSVSGQGQHEFMMEIALLSAYKHENLASLVGFCDQDGEKVLVYKHESNGSLDKFLQSKDLNWIQRLRICLDAAKGLKYLHHDVGHQHRVLHRDLKSSNILLDENWKAKISDFGLSKIGPANVQYTFLISSACGTIGYIDPEYISSGVLTQKSDVFSFGVVLLEVLCGRQAVRGYGDEREFLFTLVRNHYPMGTMDVIIDLDLLNQMKPTSLITFSTIAYQCLENRREDRPTMIQIVKQLQKALDYQVTASSGLRENAALQQGLSRFAGKESCCIFRAPLSLVVINKEAYQPQIVSIGPYHHGSRDLEMIQEHKWRFLDGFISRTGKPLESFLNNMVSMENEIRESYSESIKHILRNDLAKMMVLDGVFLIELFRKVGKLIPTDPDDPIFKMVWISPSLMRDLLRIENQIPYFVLQKLFDESRTNTDTCTLPSLILEFFNYAVDRPKEVLRRYENLEGKHLLDFFRKSFIKDSSVTTNEMPYNPSLKLIQPATKLVVAGVKFKENHEADTFLDIEFKKGVLSIPQINMDDFSTSFFLNGMAFEQCYSKCSKEITTYVVFLGCLINNSADVGLLLEREIIENCFGTDKQLVKFFNKVGRDFPFNMKDNYLKGLFIEVNEYCKNGWHVTWAGFKHKYFESPWAFFPAFTALVFLLLACLQTLYTVYPYYPKGK